MLNDRNRPAMNHLIDDFDFTQLSPAERIVLAQELWDSVLDEGVAVQLSPEDMADIERRIADVDAGRVKGEPWGVVRERLLRTL